MGKLKIKKFIQGEEQEVHALVKTVYDEFISHENTNEGNLHFYNWIVPEKIAERQIKQSYLWLARLDEKLVGMIEIRDTNNVTLLFVDKNYHGNGIATQLFQTALKECLHRVTGIQRFHVRASMCSVPVYKSFGFQVIGKAQKENGIYYVPMEMVIGKTTDNNKAHNKN